MSMSDYCFDEASGKFKFPLAQSLLFIATSVIAAVIALIINLARQESIDVLLSDAVALKNFSEKCGALFDETNILHNLSFKRSSCIWQLLGASLGQYLEWICLVNSGRLISSPWYWQKTSFLKTVFRSVITILMSTGLFVLSNYLSQLQNVGWVYCLMSSTIIVASFMLMFLMRYLFQLSKLDNFESHNRGFEGLKDYVVLVKSK